MASSPRVAPAGSPQLGTSPGGQRYVAWAGWMNVGGDRNWRNNNPGNLEFGRFASAHGAVGSDGRFAIFPDPEAGRAALETLVFRSYAGDTIAEMMNSYAPPGENDTERYIELIEAKTGLSRDQVVGDLTAAQLDSLAIAITSIEGGHAGQVYSRGNSANPDWVSAVFDTGGADAPERDRRA